MPDVKKLQFTRTIKAPVDVVWKTMFDPEGYKKWTRAFTEGSYFEGSWEQGSRIRFLAPSGDGMLAEIAENRPHQHMSIRHIGFIFKGKEDTESESVKSWAPAYENYSFESVPEGTKVIIDQDVTEDFEKFMCEAWPKSLDLLAGLCENPNAG